MVEKVTRTRSTYTLYLTSQQATDRIAEALPVVQDYGSRCVSFRADDDKEAMRTATDALAAAGETGGATLTTGLGIHKRLVAVQD
jgi:hypothetical protein